MSSTSTTSGDVLVIYTGGTIGSRPRDKDDPESPQIVVPWEEVRQGMKDLDRLVEKRGWRIDCVSSERPLDSCNIGPNEWVEFARIIGRHYDAYNGFVILHGTDTMVYTASALSFMLRGLAKPVVLTGAQRSELVDVRNDASQNLVTSLEIANAAVHGLPIIPEVMVYFGGLLLRGNRTVKRATSGYTAYESPNFPPLGIVGDAVDLRKPPIRPRRPLQLRTRLDHRILPIFVFPGITADFVRAQIASIDGLRAVVVQAYGSGNIPTLDPAFIAVFRDARKRGILVAVVTQCRNGPVELGIYETSAQLLEAGFVSASDISVEAAQCKLMVLLGDLDTSIDQAEDDFARAVAGEQSTSTFTTELSSTAAQLRCGSSIDASTNRHRFAARSLSGHTDPDRVTRAVLRLRRARVRASKPDSVADFRVFFDLDPETAPSDSDVGFAGSFRKWDMPDGDGMVVFDVTTRFRTVIQPGQRVSFTIVSDSNGSSLSWESADFAIVVDERDS